MSVDQFRAYRQTGAYGAYRVAFRKWPEMTIGGNGWTPGPAANRLAKWLEGKLGSARPEWQLHAGDSTDEGVSSRSAKRARNECRWWLDNWDQFNRGKNRIEETLPRPRSEFKILPEVNLLRPIIFGRDSSGEKRRKVAMEIASCGAKDHLGVCKHLGRVFKSEPAIALLPRFSRLADAGVAVMEVIARSLGGKSQISLAAVASLSSAKSVCEELHAAAQDWAMGTDLSLRHIETAHRFANAIRSPDPIECLTALLQHHELYGGGLRWFVLRSGRVEPRLPPLANTSGYRFRLWSLCRVATQCGVIKEMPAGLRREEEAEETEESGR